MTGLCWVRGGMVGTCWVRGGLRVVLRVARVRVVQQVAGEDRVAVSAPAAIYGRALTGTVDRQFVVLRFRSAAVLTMLTAIWTSFYRLRLSNGPRSHSWHLTTLLETIATTLPLVAASAGGTRRMTRFINFVKEIETLNMVNKVDRLPKASCGEWWVWATVAAGPAVLGLTLAAITYLTRCDGVSVLAMMFMSLSIVFRPVLVLHYVCLAMLLNTPLQVARDRLEEAVLALGTGDDYDNVAYRNAYEAVESADRTYLTACSLVKRLSSQEGLVVLLLLVSTVVRTLHSIYLILSTLDAPGSPYIPFLRPIFNSVVVAWILLEVLMIVMMTEAWNRVAGTMRSLPAETSSLLQLAAPRGVLGGRLDGLLDSLQLEAACFSPLNVCTLSRSFMVGLLSFYTTAAAVMRQFNLRDYV